MIIECASEWEAGRGIAEKLNKCMGELCNALCEAGRSRIEDVLMLRCMVNDLYCTLELLNSRLAKIANIRCGVHCTV